MVTSPPTLTLAADQSEVKAGGTILLTAVLAHSGSEAGEYALSVRGVDAAWVTLVPPTLSVAAGGQATATLLLAPPAGTAAEDLVLTVRAAGAGANAAAEARLSIRLTSTTAAPTGKARATRRLAWPQFLMIAVGVLLIAGAVGTFVARHRHQAPPQQRTADCTSESTKIVDLYSDDATTAIRITDGDLSDVRILRTEPADTLSPLFSSLLSLSPDGSRLVYVTASNEGLDDAHLWSLDVANPVQRQELASVPRGLWLVRPAWSADNRHVAFLRVNEQQAAASQSQLELWVGEIGGQPRKVASPPELRPDGFYGATTQPLCWAQDNQSVIFPSITRASSPTDQGTRATGAGQPAGGATDPGVPRQIAVDINSGATEELAFPLTASDAAPPAPAASAGGVNCGLPVFSQNDPAWRNVIMQSSGDTIGRFGCAVTATAMLLNYYGAAVTPAQLNSCLGDKADLIAWSSVVPCANGGVSASNAFDFSWPSLDQVLASGNPSIVGMVRGQTGMHFVVVTAGGGGEATDYAVIDPWDGTTTKTLQTFLDSGYNPRWIRTYAGTDRACPRLVATPTPAADGTGVAAPPDGPLLIPAQLLPLFTKVADQTGVPRELLMAVARIESGFTPRAMGPLIERFSGTEDAHALGMMQFLPSTYRTFSAQVDKAIATSASAGIYHTMQVPVAKPAGNPLGDAGIWDPEAAIWASAFFLQQNGVATDPRKALFAYNNADWYVGLVLKTAQQFKTGTIPDTNLYDPNSPSKPGTLAAPNPVNPLPLPASAAVPSPAKQAAGAQTQGGSGASGGGASGSGASGSGASGSGGGASGGSGSGGTGSGGSGTGGSGNAVSSSGGSGGSGGGAQSSTTATVPIKWSFTEGAISRTDVRLDVNTGDNIGEVLKLTLSTLSTSSVVNGGFNQVTPSRPFTSGTVVTDDGVYEAMIVTRQGGQTKTSRRKFTIDRTAPNLDVSVISSGGATTGGGATQAVRAADTTRQVANGAIRLKIGYSDTLSGVSSVEYRIDGGDWQLYFNAVTFKGEAQIDVPGDHTVDVRATDVAGNVSADRSLDFTVMNSTAVAGAAPSLKPLTASQVTQTASVVAQVAGLPSADVSATTAAATAAVATTIAPTTTTVTITVTPTTDPGLVGSPTATLQTSVPTVIAPTVAPTPTGTRAINPIVVTSAALATSTSTPTVATTTTTTATSATTTPTVTPTVSVTPIPTVTITPTVSVTAIPTANQTTAPLTSSVKTSSATVVATTTATGTPAPSLTIKLAPSVCPDAIVDASVTCTPVTVTNIGTTDLTINSFNTGGDFAIINGSTCTAAIIPNGSCQIPLSFKPTTGGGRTGSLTITDSAPDSLSTLTLTGNGLGAPRITFAPPDFICQDTEIGRSSTCSITITNIGTAALTLANGSTTTGDFTPDPATTDCGPTLARASFCRLSVAFAPSVRGTRTGVITLIDNATGSPHTIPLNGKGLAPVVEFSTAILVCPKTNVGSLNACDPSDHPDLKLKITNSGDGPLRVDSIVADGDFKVDPTKCDIIAVDPGKTCDLPVFFTPTVRGALAGSLTVFDNAIGKTQSLQLTGLGISPIVELGPSTFVNPVSISCPETIVGLRNDCPQGPITLTNTGDADLFISSIVPFDDFIKVKSTDCSTILPMQQQCKLFIAFAPTVRGAHRSGLSINDNAVGSPHSAQILGKGIAPVVLLTSPTAILCPPTDVGAPPAVCGDAPLRLTNIGDSWLNISSIVPADDFIKVATDCPTALPPDTIPPTVPALNTCSVNISFVPSVRGDFVTGLTITDDAVGSPHSVQINAHGRAPVVALNPLAVACPDTVVGQSRVCGTSLLTLTNNGDADLNIASIVPDDPFLKVTTSSCSSVVRAGANCTLPVSFAPTLRGAFTSGLTITDNAPGSPHAVQYTGRALAPVVALSATSVTCPNTIVYQIAPCVPSPSIPPVLTLMNTGDADLNISSIAPSDDFLRVTTAGCGPIIRANANCTLPISFSPFARGTFASSIAITDDAPGSPHTVQVTARGVAPIVSLSTASVTCPNTVVGTSTTACTPGTVTLKNDGDAPLNIGSIVPSIDFSVRVAPGATNCGVVVAPNGGSCVLQVTFAPTIAGNHQGSLAFVDDAPGSPHAVQLTGIGLAPVISLSTQSVACGGTPVGGTITCPVFTLGNTGTGALTISSIVLSGDFTAAITPSCNIAVQPTDTCQITVTFGPTEPGSRSGSLTIADNAPGSPHAVALIGTGQAPVVSLNASSLACPDTAVGQTAACTAPITLSNTGDAPLAISSIVPSDDFKVAAAQCPATLVVAAQCQIAVTFAPRSAGNHVGGLTITDSAAGSPHSVQLTGRGLAPVVSLSTQSVTCTGTLVGTTATCPVVTLTNSGTSALTISSIVQSGDFVSTISSNCGTSVLPNVVCQITTTFGPTAAGSRTGSLTITNDAVGSPHAIALLGTGQAPVLSISPTAITCPDTAVGATANCGSPLTLTNSGDATLSLSSIVANDDFRVSAPTAGPACGTTLAPSGSCALQVAFSPTTAGSHAGNVTIIDNAAGSPHAVQFTGNALAPAVTLSVQSVSCPDTLIGASNPCAQVGLSNTGTARLTWTGITANSPYSVARTTCGTNLDPGATCQITVVFAPGTFGNLTGFLTIADNAVGSPHKVPLSGNGIGTPALTVTQAGNCPDTAVGATAPCTLLVTVSNGSAGTGNVVLSLITISNEFAIDGARSTCGTILTPGNNCVLAVTFTPAVDGQRGGTLTITDNAPGSPHTVNLTGKGLGTPGISLSATTLACPDTPVSTTASCPTRLTITNPGTAQLTLSQVAITGSEFALDTLTNSTCGTTVAPGASCSLAINFTPSASGARTGSVRITDNGPGSPQTVTLSGNGMQAIVGLSPTAITCANTVVGVRVICSLTVTNSGNGGLNLSVAITAGGPEFVIDTSGGSSCGATLAAGATCTLSVGFTPSATGVRTGTLVMTDNAVGSPRTIALSGSGTQPAVSLSTTTIACADTQNGTTGGCQQLTLRNTGTSALTITPPLVTTTPFGTDLPNSTCGATVAAGASCVIIVNFAPTTTFTGARTGTLTITDNAPGSPHIVNLTGTGVAAAPALGVSPVTVACPAAAVSTTGTCPAVTLTNNGASAMTLTLPFATAGDFTVNTGLSTCTTTLAPSATCTLTVSFTPVVTGARNGTATIAYTAIAGSQTFIVTYRGTGT